jgi:glyoxylase-like metal-dependent hydrolase (beta-lactamase superfamily II)
MKIACFQFNMFCENTYIVWSQETNECMIVDAGMIQQNECDILDQFISKNDLKVKYLVNTHLHLDHCFGNNYISEKYNVITKAHQADHVLGHSLKQSSMIFGINSPNITDIKVIDSLKEGDILWLGNNEIHVIHVPGHTPGGIALYAEKENWVIVGDSIFANGGIGRTDLAGGDYNTLIDSINYKLFCLPKSTTIYPGHGPKSTIGQEIQCNPYI